MLSVNRLNQNLETLGVGTAAVAQNAENDTNEAFATIMHDMFLTIDGGSRPTTPVTAPLGNISCYHSPVAGCSQ